LKERKERKLKENKKKERKEERNYNFCFAIEFTEFSFSDMEAATRSATASTAESAMEETRSGVETVETSPKSRIKKEK
jgi:hypothetical protein